MASTHVVQSSFLSGVLSPSASARVETDAYQQGMLRGVNVTPIHLGGVRRRPGLRFRALCPYKLTRVSSVSTITAPNGGTTASANDDNDSTLVTTTGTVGTTNPFVVVHYDLGAPTEIEFADVVDIASDGGSSTQFAIQYSNDNSTWTLLGTRFELVDTTARVYRRQGPITARYWRVVRDGAADMGSVHISLAGFNLWRSTGVVSEGRLISFEVSTAERYVVALTDYSATVFDGDDGSYVASIPLPYPDTALADLDAAANVESLFLVHEDYPVRFFVRESATNFQTFLADFEGVPQVDFADSLSPAYTADVQTITFSSWGAGDTFQIALEGAKTAAITFAGDNDTTAANIEREVQKLWTVQAFRGVTCTRTGANVFEITFSGASSDAYDILTVSGLAGNSGGTVGGTTSVVHTTTGTPRREDIWGATRGYPRSVELFEGRLYMGGTRSRQQSLIGSAVNDILRLDLAEGLDDEALMVTLNGRQLNAINGLYAGRSLQMFTTGGEFRYVKEQGLPITPKDSPVNQTQYGSAKIRPVSIDGATIFIQRNRKSVRDFRFDYTENAYNSLGVSSLAPHLVYDVRDMAAWNGSAIDEINLVFIVNGENSSTESDAFPDGTLAVYNSRNEANVKAWTIWTTKGEFKAVATVLQERFFLVKRTINGTEGLYFEQADETFYTDCAVKIANSPGNTAVAGLDHLNGEECRVRADGFVLQNVTPVLGAAALEIAAAGIEVGLDWGTEVAPMPLQTYGGGLSSNLMRKRRVVNVRARVRNTLGLKVNGRPLPDTFFDIDNFDTPASPFTGTHSLEESTNWDYREDKIVTFSQSDPLPMEILGIDVQLEVSG